MGASKLVFYFRRIQTRSKRVQNKDRGHLFSLYVIVLRTLHALHNLTTPLKLKADLFLVVFRSLREEAEYRNGFINLSKKMFRQPFLVIYISRVIKRGSCYNIHGTDACFKLLLDVCT